MGKSVSMVMLVYNEAEIIEDVIRDYWEKVFVKLEDAEFIIAEDGSKDGTKEILARLAEEMPLKLVSGMERKGYVKAYRDAMALPQKELIFMTDSSGKHDPNDFWDMYPYSDKYDVISGYKKERKDPFYRIMMTKGFNFIVNAYFDVRINDIDSGFKIINRVAIQDILRDEWIVKDLISFEIVIRMIKKDYSFIEVPVSHQARKNGSSRGLPLKKIPKAIMGVLLSFPKIREATSGK